MMKSTFGDRLVRLFVEICYGEVNRHFLKSRSPARDDVKIAQRFISGMEYDVSQSEVPLGTIENDACDIVNASFSFVPCGTRRMVMALCSHQ